MDSTWKNDLALLAIRLMLSVVFLFHGTQKLFGWFDGVGIAGMEAFNVSLGLPFPWLGAWAAALAEVIGGLALLSGVTWRVTLPPVVFTMLVASFVAHGGAFAAGKQGMEYPLTLAVVVASLLLLGPGSWTVARLAERVSGSSSPSVDSARTA